MNCIDKMYKEVEEILKQEELEKSNETVKTPKNIVIDFSSKTIEEEKKPSMIYSKEIDISGENWVRYYLTDERVVSFMTSCLKKYLILSNTRFDYNEMNRFIDGLNKTIMGKVSEETIANVVDNFMSIIELNEEFADKFFLDQYNSVFFDDKGVFVVIDGKKYSNFPKPQPFNPNQVKKILKTSFDSYFEDYKDKFKDKEYVSTLNSFRSEINKINDNNYVAVQKNLEDKFFNLISKKGVDKDSFDEYLYMKGLRIEKQGNVYFNQNELIAFNEYKKIEFKY